MTAASTTSRLSREPTTRIRPRSAWVALDLRALWRFRDLLGSFAVRDLKLRYRQTILGVLWVVIQPLLAAGVFGFVFGEVAGLEPEGGVPYFAFALTGFVAWNAFASTLTRTGVSLVSNAHVVTKVYFPRLLLPLSTSLATLVDLAVGLSVLIGVLATVWHFTGGIQLLLAPLCLVVLLLLALGLGLCATTMSVFHRDAQHLLPLATQLLLYASPVAYSVSHVAERSERWEALFMLNPLAGVLETWRCAILGVGEVPWGAFAYSAGASVVVFVIGALVFSNVERKFADVI